MPYAAFNRVAQDEFEGSIEISQEQYLQGIDALTSGKWVVIEPGGFQIIDIPLPEEPEPYVPKPEEILAESLAERDRLLSLAAIRIAPLQDAVDLDDATPAEAALLKKWKQYRIAVNRIDQQPGFPLGIAWPVEPK